MYAIKINNDNTISVIINQPICQGYKLSDWFWIMAEPYYNHKKMAEYTATAEFVLPSSKTIINEKIILKDELYEECLKYTLSSKSKITKESGVVVAKIIFKDSENNLIRETSEFKVKISTSSDWHDDSFNDSSGDKPDSEPDGNHCNCNSEEHMKEILSKTKPLVFESVNDAEIKLNSDTSNTLYFGQIVLIKNNGKFIPYTIQQGTNGYTIEPVDTVGGNEGIFWKENE